MTENEMLRRQTAALKLLVGSMEKSNSILRKTVEELAVFKATIESEREANRLLTEELENLRAQFLNLVVEIGELIPPVDGERANDPIINRVRRLVKEKNHGQ